MKCTVFKNQSIRFKPLHLASVSPLSHPHFIIGREVILCTCKQMQQNLRTAIFDAGSLFAAIRKVIINTIKLAPTIA